MRHQLRHESGAGLAVTATIGAPVPQLACMSSMLVSCLDGGRRASDLSAGEPEVAVGDRQRLRSMQRDGIRMLGPRSLWRAHVRGARAMQSGMLGNMPAESSLSVRLGACTLIAAGARHRNCMRDVSRHIAVGRLVRRELGVALWGVLGCASAPPFRVRSYVRMHVVGAYVCVVRFLTSSRQGHAQRPMRRDSGTLCMFGLLW